MGERARDEQLKELAEWSINRPYRGGPDVYKGMPQCPYCMTDTTKEMGDKLRADLDRLLSAAKQWRDVNQNLFEAGSALPDATSALLAVIDEVERG